MYPLRVLPAGNNTQHAEVVLAACWVLLPCVLSSLWVLAIGFSVVEIFREATSLLKNQHKP